MPSKDKSRVAFGVCTTDKDRQERAGVWVVMGMVVVRYARAIVSGADVSVISMSRS
jgi:hypothetical protein